MRVFVFSADKLWYNKADHKKECLMETIIQILARELG